MNRWSVHYYNFQYLEYSDLVLTPIFIVLIYFLVNLFKPRLLGGVSSPLRSYLLPALSMKIIGAIAAGLVYQFYYHSGDTMDFYTSASFIHDLFFEKPLDAIGLLGSTPVWSTPELQQYDFLQFIYDPASWTVVRMTAVASLFAFDSYTVISLYFCLFSLYCSWKFFTVLSKLYPDPKMIQRFAYCLFYIPSVFFWGSGVFKDTLTLGGLFLFIAHLYEIVIRRKFTPSNFILLFLGLYLMYSIRVFFLIILIPCIGFWFFAEFRDKLIKNNLLKSISFPFLLIFATAVVIFGLSRVMNSESELSSKALTEKAEGFQSWHSSLGGSAYDLGIVDYSTASLIRVFPLAINVTLFRPYLWEAHSAFQLIDALQSLFFLLYFVFCIFRSRFAFFTAVTQDPMILFSITFSVFYSFVAGFTSYNFGALDRYKIPALPFFMLALVLINYKHDEGKRKVA